MIKAMDRVGRTSRLLVAMMGMGLGLLDLGCAGMSGFRSVGTERPSFLGFRNSSQPPSPTPSNDLYAQSMHAGDTKPDSRTKSTALAAARPEDGTKSTGPKPEVTTVTALDESPLQSAPTNRAVGDNTIRVTLGRPEPLPSLSQSPTATGQLASNASSARRKTEEMKRAGDDQNNPPPVQVARKDAREAAPAPLAGKSLRRAAADPKALLARAEARLNGMNTYQVKITRIERVGGQLQPEEDILLSIRRDPKAIRLEWADGPNKGREVIYSSTLDPKMIFVHMPTSPIPMPTMKIAVDSPLVMKNSRHAITEAGFDTIIENLKKAQGQATKDQKGRDTLDYKGIETASSGLDTPSHHFVRKTLSGETWNVYLDPRTMLPRLVSAEDSRGELVERYIYREVLDDPAELKMASAFVPDQRWGESNGLLSRLARAAAGPPQPPASQSTTR